MFSGGSLAVGAVHRNRVLPVSNSCIMACLRARVLSRRCSNAASSASEFVGVVEIGHVNDALQLVRIGELADDLVDLVADTTEKLGRSKEKCAKL